MAVSKSMVITCCFRMALKWWDEPSKKTYLCPNNRTWECDLKGFGMRWA